MKELDDVRDKEKIGKFPGFASLNFPVLLLEVPVFVISQRMLARLRLREKCSSLYDEIEVVNDKIVKVQGSGIVQGYTKACLAWHL